jgi:hypothetical protein
MVNITVELAVRIRVEEELEKRLAVGDEVAFDELEEDIKRRLSASHVVVNDVHGE